MSNNLTISEKLRLKLRHIYIELDEVGVVACNGRVARILDPGWHTALNPWNERLVGHISLRPRKAEGKIEVSSHDGFPFTVKVDLLFHFDPREVAPEKQMEMLTRVTRSNGENLLKMMVVREAERILRNYIGDMTIEHLVAGSICDDLEKRVRYHIHQVFSQMGISLQFPSAVRVYKPEPDIAVLNARLYTYEQESIVRLLEKYPHLRQELLWRDMLAHHENMQVHTFVSSPIGRTERPYPEQFGQAKPNGRTPNSHNGGTYREREA